MNLERLPKIAFCTTDTAEVEKALIADFERITGRALFPGNPERLFLEAVSYLISQQRFLIDYAGKMNLVSHAAGGYLDHLGAYLNTVRLDKAPAYTTLCFTLVEALSDDLLIPAGTRATADGSLYWATEKDLVVPRGQSKGEAVAVCQVPGAVGNGLYPGKIRHMVDRVAGVGGVENLTVTVGGEDGETDDRYRARVQLAPERLSVCGPADAYRWWAMSVNQAIADVAVWSPKPGEVSVAPLLRGGELPTAEIIAAVAAAVCDEKVRPLTDLVTVHYPEKIDFNIQGKYWVLTSYAKQAAAIEQRVCFEVEAYAAWQKVRLGRSIRPSELVSRIQAIDGIQRIELESPVYRSLEPWEVAHAGGAAVTYGGLANE